MHFAGFARFDDDADPRPLRLAHQMMMHGAGRQQRAERHAIAADRAVGQDDERIAVVDRRFGLGTDAVERLDQPGRAFAARPGDVDRLRAASRDDSMCLSAASCSFDRIGCGMRSRWACSSVVSSRFRSGPM